MDGLKGAVVCWLALYQGMQSWLLYLAGFGLVLGHGFPIWLKGRGGKGLAAEAGFLLVLWPGFTSVALLGLGITQLLRVPFDYCVAVAAILFIGLLTTFGQDARDVGFVVALLASSGLKKLVDRPHEQALRCQGVGADGQASCHLH